MAIVTVPQVLVHDFDAIFETACIVELVRFRVLVITSRRRLRLLQLCIEMLSIDLVIALISQGCEYFVSLEAFDLG